MNVFVLRSKFGENQEEPEGLNWKDPKDFCYFFPRFVLTLVGALGVLFLIIELPTDLGSGAILFAGYLGMLQMMNRNVFT